jgi:uncharacterized protein (TIGR00369 family)
MMTSPKKGPKDYSLLVQVMEEMIPFNRFLGLRVAHVERGFVRIEIPFRDELVGDWMRPALHGGVISMATDVAGGFAVWTHLDNDLGRVSTIDMRVDYLRPGRLLTLLAEARVVRVGNRVGVADVRVFHPDAEDVTVAMGKGVYNLSIPKA